MRKSNSLSIALALLVASVCILVCAPLLSLAHSPFGSITIVNNSSREIRHVYLSAPDNNNWGADQLVHSVIPGNGGSFTISSVSCGAAGIKVIAEDEDGCFLYQVVSCSGNATWTITNSTTRDCGNQ